MQGSPTPSPRKDGKRAILEAIERQEGRARGTLATEKVQNSKVAPQYVCPLAFRGKKGKGEGDAQFSATLFPRKRDDRSGEGGYRSSGSPGNCTVANTHESEDLTQSKGLVARFCPLKSRPRCALRNGPLIGGLRSVRLEAHGKGWNTGASPVVVRTTGSGSARPLPLNFWPIKRASSQRR